MPVTSTNTNSNQRAEKSAGVSFSWMQLQPVAQSTDSCDLEGILPFREMFPQAVDVYIQGAVVALKIIAPDIFDQLLARKRPARITGQLEQQLETL